MRTHGSPRPALPEDGCPETDAGSGGVWHGGGSEVCAKHPAKDSAARSQDHRRREEEKKTKAAADIQGATYRDATRKLDELKALATSEAEKEAPTKSACMGERLVVSVSTAKLPAAVSSSIMAPRAASSRIWT